MSELAYESPLAGVAAPGGLAVSLREITGRGMIDLRGHANDAAFMSAVRQVLGVALPAVPRTSASAGGVTALWLSADQWLITAAREDAAGLLARLKSALQGIHALAVDVSDMRAIIRLEGEGCREILMKGTSLDLLSGDYTPGTCRRMRFAEIAALLHVAGDDAFDVYVFRSYAHYAWEFLCATARESARVRLFGAQAQPA